MLIKLTKHDREVFEEQLLKLVKENKSDISHASEKEIQAGIATFSEYFSVNQALMIRAIDTICAKMSANVYEGRALSNACQDDLDQYMAQEKMEQELDSVGPELLGNVLKNRLSW